MQMTRWTDWIKRYEEAEEELEKLQNEADELEARPYDTVAERGWMYWDDKVASNCKDFAELAHAAARIIRDEED